MEFMHEYSELVIWGCASSSSLCASGVLSVRSKLFPPLGEAGNFPPNCTVLLVWGYGVGLKSLPG